MTNTPSQSKSDRTRTRIHNAARTLFSKNGYDGTSIRDIAAEADCDPALVMRYFVSKDRLFAATAEFDLKLPDLGAVIPSQHGAALVGHFLDLWESADSGPVLIILLRSAASNELAANQLREVFATQVLPALSQTGTKEQVEMRAGLVSSQLLGLALGRYILKLKPVAEMSKANILKNVGPVIQSYLEA